jgi:hypothetical protein
MNKLASFARLVCAGAILVLSAGTALGENANPAPTVKIARPGCSGYLPITASATRRARQSRHPARTERPRALPGGSVRNIGGGLRVRVVKPSEPMRSDAPDEWHSELHEIGYAPRQLRRDEKRDSGSRTGPASRMERKEMYLAGADRFWCPPIRRSARVDPDRDHSHAA